MIPHLWQLRADVRPLEEGARQWGRISAGLSRTADDIVAAARHALDQGWESEAAESFEDQRRRLVQQIDTFTTVAAHIGSSLTALAGLVTTAQEELDRVWGPVAVVPHELIGSQQVLVLRPATPADEELVRSATGAAEAIRSRLDLQLDAESARLRNARMEVTTVRSELVQMVGGEWPVGVASAVGDLGESLLGPGGRGTWGLTSGLGTASGAPGSTSVAGAAAGGPGVGGAGVAGSAGTPVLPALAPVSFSAPDLTGLSAAALAAGTGLAGRAAVRRGRKPDPQAPSAGTGMAPMGGMAAGAAMRGGALGRPGGAGTSGVGGRSGGPSGTGRSGGSSGPRGGKPLRPQLESPEDRAARLAREKEEAREAKRKLIAERQAERAARRAQREGARDRTPPAAGEEGRVAPDEDGPGRR